MQWERAAGVLLHPTSLPGPHGSGDLGAAAHRFVDWLALAGQKLWQILPLGGIGPGDSPYMSTSAFAGNVLLIDLADLHAHGWLDAGELAPAAALRDDRVDFAAVVPYRMERLRRAARRFFAEGTAGATRADFDAFCAEQSSWLDDHALFMALADHFDWQPWNTWPAPLVQRDAAALAAARREHAQAIDFRRFCQWRFFRQWAALKQHANERGVRIVGDAPIFIAHQSAEVWSRPELFELDARGAQTVVAGTPPDGFAPTGQRWGNPLYRWPAHEAEGFAWWIERIRRTFELVDVVRIDHFCGFVRYWEVPASEPTAQNGRWQPAPGTALFSAIQHALPALPIIAEDLGVMIPAIEELRVRFQLPGMKILQSAFGRGSGNGFLPHNHPRDAVVYTGTHDNDTTRGWWATASEAERTHALAILGSDGREIHWDLIRAAMASVADTAVVPLQDVLGLGSEGRMNFPGQASGWWAWRYRDADLQPAHAERLAALVKLFRRDGTPVVM